jgi:NADPH2:quinone reductase
VAGPDEVLVEVKAVAVENVDKLVAAGQHYASGRYTAQLPAIPGFDGVGTLPDGTLIGFGPPRAPYGALAERTVVGAGRDAHVRGADGPAQRDRGRLAAPRPARAQAGGGAVTASRPGS